MSKIISDVFYIFLYSKKSRVCFILTAHFNHMFSAPMCPHVPHVGARVRITALGSWLLLPCFAMNVLLPA